MIRTGGFSRMTMMKVGDCEDNAEGWGLFKDDDEGWELFKDGDDRNWEL